MYDPDDDDDMEEIEKLNIFISNLVSTLTKTISNIDNKNQANPVNEIKVSIGNQNLQFDIPNMQQDAPKLTDASPLIDVIDDGNSVHVVLQMNGIDKKNIKVTAKAEQVSVSVTEDKNCYTKSVNMPCMVEAASAEATYNNGILELRLKKMHSDSFNVDIK